ncbi:E75 nuclear receptor [Elysia marginata]|uniref:E75 nuclear receptor n=1 Tax=Elysia marginata TaxID=1093978 RepID=A0AAV4K4I3_9GAST|nr:E75 nuclear receptor [Elysia marginata]
MGRKRKILKPDEGDKHSYLPPCRVCEGPAGGFHYGVNTCEACKGFFHRSSSGKEELKCDSGGNCPVLYTISRICKKCRYTKCIAVGMARKAIKTGRYTVEKRTKDILEVKRLQGKRPAAEENPLNRSTNRKLDSDSNKSHKAFSEWSQQEGHSDKPTCEGLNSNPEKPEFECHTSTTASLGHYTGSSTHTTSIDCSPVHSLSPFSQSDHLSPNMSNISSSSSPCMLSQSSKAHSSNGCDSNLSQDNCMSPSSANVSSHSQCPCSQDIHELYSDMDKVVSILAQARADHIKHLLPNKSKEEMLKMAAEHTLNFRFTPPKGSSVVSPNLNANSTPLDCLRELLTDEILNSLLESINSYAEFRMSQQRPARRRSLFLDFEPMTMHEKTKSEVHLVQQSLPKKTCGASKCLDENALKLSSFYATL